MTHKLCQNANFENGGITTQIGTLRVLLNILSISLLFKVMTPLGFSRCKKISNVICFEKK